MKNAEIKVCFIFYIYFLYFKTAEMLSEAKFQHDYGSFFQNIAY